MKKRGQITIFIIIGIVLLLSVAVALYFYQTRVTAPIKRVVAVPEEVQQIYDYVATCANQIGKDGLLIMGTQGGYINIPPIIDRNPNAYVAADPAGISKTPMWYYEGEDRTPSLEFMQRELALYVKQNMPDCVANFEAFKERFDVTPKSDLVPVVTFTDSEVIIEIKWQLDIKIQERLVQLTEFVVSFPLKLRLMHELAKQTMEMENKEGWFENLTIDLMSTDTKIPLSGMEFSCGTKKWHIQNIKKELQNLLYYNLPLIRIENTNYPPPLAPLRVYANLKEEAADIREQLAADKEPDCPENTPADVFEMNRMMLDVGARKTDLKAAFVYFPEWPLLLNAQPSSGGTLSTAQMKGARKYLRFFCVNQWHFAYDVIYPVKMMIRDDTAFNEEGYIFQMAFPVIIEDNEESRVFFGLRRFVIPDVGTDFCTNFGTQAIDVRAKGFVGGLVAEDMEDANITYKCLNQECIMGKTISDGTGAIHFNTYLPEGCANPTIVASKEGFLPGQANVAGMKTVDIMMTKLKRMPYTLAIMPYDTVNKKFMTGTYYKLPKTMHATIAVSLRNGTFDQYKTYPASGEAYTTGQEGKYQLAEISEVAKDEIDFVYDDANYDIDILLFKGSTVVGGYHAENITIEYREINAGTNAVFNVVEFRPVPDTTEKQTDMFLFLYESGMRDSKPYTDALKPKFT